MSETLRVKELAAACIVSGINTQASALKYVTQADLDHIRRVCEVYRVERRDVVCTTSRNILVATVRAIIAWIGMGHVPLFYRVLISP